MSNTRICASLARVAAMLAMLQLISTTMAASSSISVPPIPAPLLMNSFSLSSSARCNDGSVPSYFYRNCSANWDRKPGDPDFCEKGSIEGVAERVWFISFDQGDMFSADASTAEDNAGWCASSSECQSRGATLTSSTQWPSTFFPSGVFSAFAEQNPNFYKSVHVTVPYCSSDAWLGDADANAGEWNFHGRRIVAAVLDDLFATKQLGDADSVVLVGGTGLMLQLPDLLPRFAPAQRVYAVCDGCLLIDTAGTVPPTPSTLIDTLARAFSTTWNASVPQAAACASAVDPATAYECALSAPLVESLRLATNTHDALAGVFFSQPLLDRAQLTAIGAWPPVPGNSSSPARTAFASHAVTQLRKIGDASRAGAWKRAPFVLGAACFAPTACARNALCAFSTLVGSAPCDDTIDAANGSIACAADAVSPVTQATFVTAASLMIRNHARAPQDAVQIVDKTYFVNANPTCAQKI